MQKLNDQFIEISEQIIGRLNINKIGYVIALSAQAHVHTTLLLLTGIWHRDAVQGSPSMNRM